MMRRAYGVLPTLARLGLGVALAGSHLPADDAAPVDAMSATPRAGRNARDELSMLPVVFEQARALTTLGDRPLVVLTSAENAVTRRAGPRRRSGWRPCPPTPSAARQRRATPASSRTPRSCRLGGGHHLGGVSDPHRDAPRDALNPRRRGGTRPFDRSTKGEGGGGRKGGRGGGRGEGGGGEGSRFLEVSTSQEQGEGGGRRRGRGEGGRGREGRARAGTTASAPLTTHTGGTHARTPRHRRRGGRPHGHTPLGADVVALVAQVLVVIDISVVNTAMPTIGGELGLASADLQWVVTAYLLLSGGCLLLGGRIADLVSRRAVFLTGLTLFTSASLFTGLAGGAAGSSPAARPREPPPP